MNNAAFHCNQNSRHGKVQCNSHPSLDSKSESRSTNHLFITFYFIVFFRSHFHFHSVDPCSTEVLKSMRSEPTPPVSVIALLTVQSAAAVACEVHRLAFETPVCSGRPCVSEQMGRFEIGSRKTLRFIFDRRLPSFTARSDFFFFSTAQRQYGATPSTQSVHAAKRHTTIITNLIRQQNKFRPEKGSAATESWFIVYRHCLV